MKPYILSGVILLLIVGITLAGNSLEVSGQSDMERQKILEAASNAAANATADVMKKAEVASSIAPTATEKELKKYENDQVGVRFEYPSSWGEPTEVKDCLTTNNCFVTFMIRNSSGEDSYYHMMGLGQSRLDKPVLDSEPCNCKTLKDFVAWDYTTYYKGWTIINQNQTIIPLNVSAWQTEAETDRSPTRSFKVLTVSGDGNVGYTFLYWGPPDTRFDRYLDGFKNMLKTVTFTIPTPEKNPSYLNSNELQNPSVLSSAPVPQNKSIKILSSNDFIDSIGYLHVVGEVENNTPANIQFIKVTGTFYDSNNQVVGTDFTYTNPTDIGPGQKAPFELILSSASIPITQIDHYNLQATYD